MNSLIFFWGHELGHVVFRLPRREIDEKRTRDDNKALTLLDVTELRHIIGVDHGFALDQNLLAVHVLIQRRAVAHP